MHHSINNNLAEKLLLSSDNLGVERSLGALHQQITLFFISLILDLHGDFFNPVCTDFECVTVPIHNDTWVHTILNKLFRLFKQFTSHQHYRSSSITHLIILRFWNVDESLSSGVHDIEQWDQCSTIIWDGDTASIVNKFVHTARTYIRRRTFWINFLAPKNLNKSPNINTFILSLVLV